MKRFLLFVMSAIMLFSCSDEYDDSGLWNSVNSLEGRVAQLEQLCKQMNTNISSLRTLVEAVQQNDYVQSVTPVTESGKTIGYTITFTKSKPITIYHGKDGTNGKDGQDGEDGKDGTNGKDGSTPMIGVKQDTDGIYYWTLNGEWLTDGGNKIKAQGTDGKDGEDGKDGQDGQDGEDGDKGQDGTNGKDGITPKLKIEDGYWFISYDDGQSWTQLGKATGEDGKDGQDGKPGADGEDGKDGENGQDGKDAYSIFKEVTQDDDYVHFILQDDSKISVPKHRPLSVAFSETEDIRVLTDKTYSIGYTITGADENTVIKALAQDGFRAVIKSTDYATGTIEITTPNTILPSEVLVFVTDGKERTIMRSINFVEGVILITTKSYTVDYNGGTIMVDLSTNIDYTVEIPEADKSWISVADTRTRAVMRDETLTFTIQPNENTVYRYSTIKLIDNLGVTGETILITQKSGTSRTLNVTNAGTLEQLISSNDKDIIEELKLTGTLNIFDYEFISTMPNLKAVDLSELNDTSIPANAFVNSKISTVLLPLKLEKIANRAFYQAEITSIYIPENVETIGQYAFYGCSSLKGNLVIPDATTVVDDGAFQNCAFDGILQLGSGIKTIGLQCFHNCSGFTGDLVIPNSVETIKGYAFTGCTGFSGNLIIGNNVQEILESTFENCSGLSGTLRIGENVTKIDMNAFKNCSKLSGNLIIPDKVTYIGPAAFYGCGGFNGYLLLGSSVSRIDRLAFVLEHSEIMEYQPKPNDMFYIFEITINGLNFTKVYSKNTVPPELIPLSFNAMNYGSNTTLTTISKQSVFGIKKTEGYLNNNYSGHKFVCYGSRPPILCVSIGCKELYKWGFANTEEVEF